jgi:RNA polymerase sigma factor (sigma-70 family)
MTMAHGPLAPLLRHIRRLLGPAAETPLTDGQLLDRFVSRRDGEAFAALMARHGAMVLGVCRRALGHEQEAEDAFQATFLILARKAGSIRRQELLASWLCRVAYHVAVTARARAARRRTLERQVATMATAASTSDAAGRELRLLLDEELNHLPRKYHAPLVLCYLEGMTHEEAARELRWPTGTVKGRLARAREMLRQRLVRRGLALSAGLVGTLLAEEAAARAVPAALAGATLQAALVTAAGHAAAGLVSAEVVALVEGVSQAMFLTRLKIVAAVVLAVLLVAGAGLVPHQMLSAGGSKPAAPPAAQQGKDADKTAATLPVEKAALTGHTDAVLCLACSLDGKLLASGSADKTVRLWDVKTMKEIATLQGHDGAVTLVVFSPDKRTLFSASADKSVKAWDPSTGKELRSFAGHKEPITTLGFSRYGKLLYTASADKLVHGWVVEDGREMPQPWPLEFAGTVTVMQGNLSGRWITLGRAGKDSASNDMVRWELPAYAGIPSNMIRFEVPAGKEIARFQGHTGEVTAVTVSPDLRKLASASADKTAKLWDLDTGKELATLKGHEDAVRGVAFDPRGRKLVTASADKTVKLWDTTTGKELATLPGHTDEVTSVAFSPDGRTLFTGSADKTVKAWTLP